MPDAAAAASEGRHRRSSRGSKLATTGSRFPRPDAATAESKASSFDFHLGLDGISVALIVLTTLLTVSCVLISWESIAEREAEFYTSLLALETGLIGVFCAFDLMLFYVFFEFTLIPLFFLIGIWGGPQRRYAAVKFFLYTLAGSLITLLGLVALVLLVARQMGSRRRARCPTSRPGSPRIRSSPRDADRAVPGALGRLPDQGAGVSVPHLVAAGARRSADGRQRAAGRRAAEARHLRLPAALPAAASRRVPRRSACRCWARSRWSASSTARSVPWRSATSRSWWPIAASPTWASACSGCSR